MTTSPPPSVGPWRTVTIPDLLHLLYAAAGTPSGRPRVVAIDGRAGSGRANLATRLQAAAWNSAVVRIDDVAWHGSFFNWTDPLTTEVLQPLHRGDGVRYRPPAWTVHGQPGAITIEAGLELVWLEGVGAGRRELAPWLDAIVWVESDPVHDVRPELIREIGTGINDDASHSAAFTHVWTTEEHEFLQQDQPWLRACTIVAGPVPPEWSDDEVMITTGPGSNQRAAG